MDEDCRTQQHPCHAETLRAHSTLPMRAHLCFLRRLPDNAYVPPHDQGVQEPLPGQRTLRPLLQQRDAEVVVQRSQDEEGEYQEQLGEERPAIRGVHQRLDRADPLPGVVEAGHEHHSESEAGEDGKPTGDVGQQRAPLGRVPAHHRQHGTGEHQESAPPQRPCQKVQSVHQLGERHVSPVGRMTGGAAGQGQKGCGTQHHGGDCPRG